MNVTSFDYIAPGSLAEAVELLADPAGGARVLAGGTDLLVQLRHGWIGARRLVDIKAIPEANVISYNPVHGLVLGAAVACYRLCKAEVLIRHFQGLLDAIGLIGGVQIQGRATLGGNLCNASPAADSIPALIVHRASAICVGPIGWRTIPTESFCVTPGKTVLEQGELLVAIQVPAPEPGFGAAYLRFIPRNEMDIAVVGAAAAVTLDDSRTKIVAARVALAAVAPTPLLVVEAGEYLVGRDATIKTLIEASEIARKAARPITDLRGTAAQRKHLVGVLTRRVLEKAIQRARS